MKKRIVSILMAAVLLLVCAAPVWADTDKEIQFSDYVFGETFAEAARKKWVNTIEFQKKPKTSRAIADPAYSNACWELYSDSPVGFCFFSRLEERKEVAGHSAGIVLRFYFPTPEAAAAFDVQQAVLYGGEYEFGDDNKKAIFDDLKQKLTTVYGTPAADSTNPEDFWGKPAHQEGMTDEDAERIYREKRAEYHVSYAVWKQSGTDRQIILVYSLNQDGWENTVLYYLDASADALIEQMYQQAGQGTEGVAYNGSLEGL